MRFWHKGEKGEGTHTQSVNTPARASVAFTAVTIFSKLAALVFTPIFTRLLSTDEYGEYSLFTTSLSLLIVIGSLELPGSVLQRVLQSHKGYTNTALLYANAITMLFSATAFSIFLIFNRYFNLLSFPLASFLLIVTLISSCLINLYNSAEKYLYHFGSTLISGAVQSVLAPLLAILMINSQALYGAHRVTLKLFVPAVLSAVVAMAFFIITAVKAARERRMASGENCSRKEARASIVKKYFSLAIPMLPYYASVSVIAGADRFFISTLFGSDALAKYSVAHSLGTAISAVGAGVLSALLPWIMRKIRANRIPTIRCVLDELSIAYALFIICFLSVADILLSFIAPTVYSEALAVVFASTLSVLPLALLQIASNVCVAKEKLRGIVIIGTACAAIAVLANVIILPHASPFAAAVISAACYSLLSVTMLLYTRIVCKEWILSPARLLALEMLSVAAAFILYAIQSVLILRLFVFVISFALLGILLWHSRGLILEKGECNG